MTEHSFTLVVQNTLKAFAELNQTTLQGKYDLVVTCRDELGLNNYGEFRSALWMTDAQNWVTTDPSAPQATTATLVPTPTTAAAGASVALKATIAPAAAGTVTFYDGTTALGTATVAAGVANLSTTALATAGSHSLKAVFAPTGSGYLGSTSSVVTFTVTKATTTTTLAATPGGSAAVGGSVALKATVAPAGPGAVEFFDGTTSLGTASVSGGIATLNVSTLGAGQPHAEGAVHLVRHRLVRGLGVGSVGLHDHRGADHHPDADPDERGRRRGREGCGRKGAR